MTDRQLIQLAAQQLPPELLVVWLQKHAQHTGRRAGSRFLEISENMWRYRLREAERIMARAIDERKEPAA